MGLKTLAFGSTFPWRTYLYLYVLDLLRIEYEDVKVDIPKIYIMNSFVVLMFYDIIWFAAPDHYYGDVM